MSRAVIYEKFGGPEVLEVQDVPEPHAGPGEVRVRVAAVGLNPMDPAIAASPELAARFNITVPSGFAYDFAGAVDEVGDGASGFAIGERVYGGVMERAAADFIVVKTPFGPWEALFHTPEGLSDEVASTMAIAGGTASAALAAIELRPEDTVLIGGAAGGVGVFAVQLAKLAGATVIGTASQGTFPFLRKLGAEPVTYGVGLADRVRALAPGGITAAIDLFGTETVETALALGVAPERIDTIADFAAVEKFGVKAEGNAAGASAETLAELAGLIADGALEIPIARVYPLDQVRDAYRELEHGHTRGKIVLTP